MLSSFNFFVTKPLASKGFGIHKADANEFPLGKGRLKEKLEPGKAEGAEFQVAPSTPFPCARSCSHTVHFISHSSRLCQKAPFSITHLY